jgi:hypothetical protein
LSFNQEVVRVLRQAPGQRMVLLTRQGDRLLTTRFFLQPVKLALGGLVEQVTVTGEGSIGGLPEAVTLALEGYRVRAGLGELPGLPSVVSAGVTRDVGGFLPDPGEGLGYAYVSTHFIAGESLAQVGERLATGEKLALLRRLLRLLASLHERLVVYGDLKPHNVIAVGEEPWLIDLDTMRKVPRAELPIPTRDLTPSYAAPEQAEDQLTYLASDVFSFGRLGTWLLESELASPSPAPAVAAWKPRLAWAMAEHLAARPSARALCEEAGVSPDAQDEDPAITVPVLDILDKGSGDAETVQAWAGVFASEAKPAETARPPGAKLESTPDGAPAAPAERAKSDDRALVFRALAPAPLRPKPEARPATAPPGDPRAATELVGNRRRPAALAVAAALTFIGIAALLAAIFIVPSHLRAGTAPEELLADAAPPPADAGPPPYRHCDNDATRIILGYLSIDDAIPSPSELLAWFPSIRPEEVEVYRFSHEDTERRFVSFELSRDGFTEWPAIADDASGAELCTRLGHELAARRVGPPRDPQRPHEHDYRFLAKRPERVQDAELIGDLRGVANGDTYAAILDWLSPLEVEVSHCRARGGWLSRATLEVECRVKNVRDHTAALRLTATMSREGHEPISRDRRLILDPDEDADVAFAFDEFDERLDTYCNCSVETLP